MKYRINKFLATAGIASRRQAEKLIQVGRVSVNGKVVINLATTVDSENDVVCFDAEEVTLKKDKVYVVVNKPVGYICSHNDPQGRPQANQLLPDKEEQRLFSIGRLDIDTEGLLCFTNDGSLAHRTAHPKYVLDKEYLVLLNKPLKQDHQIQIKQASYMLNDGPAPKARLLQRDCASLLWSLTITEGRNRIIRRMFEALDYKIMSLKRITIGPIKLAELPLGKYRYLNEGEIKALRKRLL